MSEDEHSGEIARLVPTKSEAEIAADIKKRVEAAFQPVLAIFDEAALSGLHISWESIGLGPSFKHQINNLRIIKYYY
jgi:hypothetical protein